MREWFILRKKPLAAVALFSLLLVTSCSGESTSSSTSYTSQPLGAQSLLYVSDDPTDFTAVGATAEVNGFTTLQAAVYAAAEDAEIRVFPGTYPTKVYLDRSVTIVSTTNKDLNPLISPSVRLDEVLFVPAEADLLAGFLFEVAVSDVTLTLKGLTLDGDIPEEGDRTTDVRTLIKAEQQGVSLVLENNILRNATYSAMSMSSIDGALTATHNLVQNVTSTVAGYGFDIRQVADVSLDENVIEDVTTGIGFSSYYDLGPRVEVTTNEIHARERGMGFKNIYTGTFTVSDNEFFEVEDDDYPARSSVGVALFRVHTGGQVYFLNNEWTDFDYGINAWGGTAPRILVENSTMSGVTTGVLLGNESFLQDGVLDDTPSSLYLKGTYSLTGATHAGEIRTGETTDPYHLVLLTGTYTLGSSTIVASGTAADVVLFEPTVLPSVVTGVTPRTTLLQDAVAGVRPLTTVFELAALVYEPTSVVALQNDLILPLDWKPIEEFRGTMDGQDYLLYPITQPLFASLHGATIQDLSLTGTVSDFDGSIYGALAQVASNSSVISGINGLVSVTLDATETPTIGGLLGELTSSTLEDSIHAGDVTMVGLNATAALGGLVGKATQGVLTNNTNQGTVKSVSGTVGGILGQGFGVELQENRNSGLVEIQAIAEATYAAEVVATGGIVGSLDATTLVADITNNVNYREVRAPHHLGGIVGHSFVVGITSNDNMSPTGVQNPTLVDPVIPSSTSVGDVTNAYSGFLIGQEG